jgi:hypothetical protein
MEHNIFETQPEWIQQDDRRHRHELVWSPGKPDPSLAYNINPEFMYHRHRVMLPPELIRGKTVLDVGSCMGATGAWCLSEGAAHYTGIEPLERYARPSEQLFRRYHQADRYDIRCCSLEQFQADRQHDIVVASGVLVMAFADGLAGLVGPQVASPSWRIVGQRRSLAGTATMALTSLAVLLALAALAGASGRPVPIPAALVVIALAATLLEQVGIGGLDNLSVPLAVAWLWSRLTVV